MPPVLPVTRGVRAAYPQLVAGAAGLGANAKDVTVAGASADRYLTATVESITDERIGTGVEAGADLQQQAALHRALGDPHRLAVVAWLELTDATPTELAERLGLASNLVAFHLDVLEEVGLITRHRSQGDGRRRYVTLGPTAKAALTANVVSWEPPLAAHRVVFVCTHNSARSQLASAMWTARTGRESWSAGSRPADRVNPDAVVIAADHGLDLSSAMPCGYDQVEVDPDLVVSVCDRVREEGLPFDAPLLHWSVPDPTRPADFPHMWQDVDGRVVRLAERVAA